MTPPDLPNTDTKHKLAIEPFPSLSRCRGLRELEISLPNLPRDEVSLFSSITSTDLRKIVLPVRYEFGRPDFSRFGTYPRMLDDCLYRLVERLRQSRYEHRLELEYRIWHVLDYEGVSDEFLPKFREQGLVKFVSGVDGRVVYSSDW